MSRAQEIRQKRLNERRAISEKKIKHDMEVKAQAETLFDWVLDMFEHPTDDNTADEVCLVPTYFGYIRIGHDCQKGFTKVPFDEEVMKQLAEMFEAEDGFSVTLSDNYRLTIKIE